MENVLGISFQRSCTGGGGGGGGGGVIWLFTLSGSFGAQLMKHIHENKDHIRHM